MTRDMDRAKQRRWALLLRRAVKSGRIPPVRGHSIALRLKLNLPPVAIIDQQLGNALFEAVESGKFSPARAEAIAMRLGLPALNPPPAYDPAKADRWTLPMALAWIAYRDLGEVAKWAVEYREQARAWVPSGNPFGKVLRDKWDNYRPSIDDALRHIAVDRAYAENMNPGAPAIPLQPLEMLWGALGDGLHAVGYSAGALVEVPKFQWPELKHRALPDEPDALAFKRSLAPAYHGVTVSRSDLFASFKATSKVVESAEPKATDGSPRYEEFREAMIARIKDDPQKTKPENARMTKLEVKQWAANEFGLSGEATEAERASIMRTLKDFSHVWDKGGRPRKAAV
ncbi:MAG: hypothetical protein ACK4G5_08250 [Devosia sp.]